MIYIAHFFAQTTNQNYILLSKEDSHHAVDVLRLQLGDNITVSDGVSTIYNCCISKVTDGILYADILSNDNFPAENAIKLTLYQAIPKGDKLDFIVQKAVELGVDTIVPFDTKRCVSRPDRKGKLKKTVRLNKIAQEACKQSIRTTKATVHDFLSFSEALDHAKDNDLNIIFYEKGGIRICEALKDKTYRSIGIFVGSEGGFEDFEVLALSEMGALTCTLGRLILRCETAPITAISIIQSILGRI